MCRPCANKAITQGISVIGTDVHMTIHEVGRGLGELTGFGYIERVGSDMYRIKDPMLVFTSTSYMAFMAYQFLLQGKPAEETFELFTELLVTGGDNVDPKTIQHPTVEAVVSKYLELPTNSVEVMETTEHVLHILEILDDRLCIIVE